MKITKAASMLAALAVAASAFAALPVTSFADAPLYSYDFATVETVYSNDFTSTVVEAYTFDSDPGASWSIGEGASVADGVLAIKGTKGGAGPVTTYTLPDINDGGVYDIIWNKTSTGNWFQVDLAEADGTPISGQWMIIQNAAGNNYNHSNAVSDISPHRVRIDTSTGAWSAYTGSYLTASGTSNPAEGYMLKFNSWEGSGTVHSLQDLTVSKVDLTGWYKPSSSKTEPVDGKLVISNSKSWGSSAEVDTVFSLSDLDADSTYEITWEGMSGGEWTAMELIDEGNYTTAFFQSKTQYYVTTGVNNHTADTMVPVKIILYTGTGKYSVYVNGNKINLDGAVTTNSDYQLNFHTTGDNFTYTIDNFKVEKVVAADTTNWTLTNASAESNRLAIGSNGVAELNLSALDANSIYDIEWDWIGNSGNNWLDFGVYSGTESYQIAEKFNSDTQTAALHYNSNVHSLSTVSTSNKITLNTKTGEWTVYVNDDEKISGATAATSGYSFKLHSWADVTHYIDNVTVTKTGVAAEPVSADADVYSVNSNGTYNIGATIIVNPSLYNNVVFEIGEKNYYGGAISSVFDGTDNTTALQNIRGDAEIGIIFESAASTDVKVIFTNESLTYAPVD